MSTILVVDDEERIRTMLARALADVGHRVVGAPDGDSALAQLRKQDFDLVLLDLVLPRTDGLGVLDKLPSLTAAPPVIVLTGMHDVSARIQALNKGAVDVVAKPFVLVELLARVNRHLGASNGQPRNDHRFLSAAGLRLDTNRRLVERDERHVVLSERESALLAHLLRRAGDVCTREELLNDVWGLDFDPGSNLVEVCIGRLRQKLSPDPPIETVRRVGYCIPNI
ncbi:MAG: response regulator transcription factor [Pedococcus sp.]